MFNTLQIYDELSQTMDQKSARKLVNVMSSMYEELRNSVTKEEFSALQGTVQELAGAQTRTEQGLNRLTERVEELAEAQKRTEARVEELAEAQKRTEARVEELVEAQTHTEQRLNRLTERVEELAEAQKRTEKAVFHLSKRIDQTNKQLGGLNMTVGYTLENEAYRFLPELLRQDWQIETIEPLRRDWLPTTQGKMVEVNIVGTGRRNGETLLLIGESKLQLSRKYVDTFLSARLQRLDTGGLNVFPIIIAHMESEPGVVKYAKEQGIAVYLSYQFQRV